MGPLGCPVRQRFFCSFDNSYSLLLLLPFITDVVKTRIQLEPTVYNKVRYRSSYTLWDPLPFLVPTLPKTATTTSRKQKKKKKTNRSFLLSGSIGDVKEAEYKSSMAPAIANSSCSSFWRTLLSPHPSVWVILPSPFPDNYFTTDPILPLCRH